MSVSDVGVSIAGIAQGMAQAEGPPLDDSGMILPSEYPNVFAAVRPDKTARAFNRILEQASSDGGSAYRWLVPVWRWREAGSGRVPVPDRPDQGHDRDRRRKRLPAEVQSVLRDHPAILDCAVFGLPHPKWGEGVTAALEIRPGLSVDPDEVISFARQSLAAYKIPRRIEVGFTLPRTASGKVQRALIRKHFLERDQG